MKTKFKIGFLLVCFCLIISMTSIINAFAADANISMTVSKSEINVGDTFTVVISNADLNAAGFGVVLDYSAKKDLIECTDVKGVDDDEYLGMYYSGRKGAATWIDANVGNDAANTNSDGIFSFGVVTGKATDFFEGTVATLTFNAKAAGSVTFTLTERTSGTDAFDGVVETFTLTIKEAAPACEHEYVNGCSTICIHCGEERPAPAHNVIHVEAKAPSCAEMGNIEYWYCSECEQHWLDAECMLFTNPNVVKIDPTCKYNAIHMDAVPASCHYNGNCEYWYCANCDVYYLDEECTIITKIENVIIPMAHGDIIAVEAKDATCYENGNIEHWYCADCGQAWLDAECTLNTNLKSVILPAGHSFLEGKRGALLSAGNCITRATYASKCDNCNFENETRVIEGEFDAAVHASNETYFGEQDDYNHYVMYSCCHNVKETVSHTVDESKTKEFELQPASCCDDGFKQIVKYCVCGYEISNEDDVVIPATGMHSSLSKNEATIPNCRFAGHAAYWRCDTVGRDYSDEAGTKKIEDLSAWLAEGGEGYIAPDPENHIGIIVYTYDDDTHSSYYDCCETPVVTDEPHDFDPDTHKCFCGAVEHVCEHDEYATTATTHQSICECGAPLGDEEEHEFENGKCVVCEYECQHGDEMGSFPEGCVSNGDGTHSWLALCDCGVTYAESTDECSGGTANCVMQAICSDCGTEYGDIDPANHAGEKLYRDSFENMSQHLVYCNKCGELWDSQNPYAPHEADEEGYCKCGLFVVVQDFNGGQISTKPPYPEMTEEDWTDMVESQLGGFDVTSMSRFTFGLSILVEDENIAMMNLMFVKEGYKLVGLAYDAEGTQRYNGENIEKPTTLYYVWEPLHTHAHDHYDITETTHQSICSCGEILGEAEEHEYTTSDAEHTCVCGKVEKFILTISYKGNELKYTIPYGAKVWDYIEDDFASEGELFKTIRVKNEYMNGSLYKVLWTSNDEGMVDIDKSFTMPDSDTQAVFLHIYDGWHTDENGTYYNYFQGSGWYYIEENYDDIEGGAWYYIDPETGYRVEGLSRVPYPTAPINGILYAPNAEDLAYAANKGREFIDATEAWFVFGEDGKFQFDMTEIMDGKYVENGMIAWHPGFVTVGGELYYFVGDKENGGNIWANGDVIVSRLNGAEGFVNNGTYNFVDGRLNKQNGIEPGANGKLYYYINGHKQVKLGLTKLGEGKYIYVRSNGELAVGEYYIPANGLGVVSTLYTFDANGYMVNPKYTNVNGIVDGYYYVNGKIDYGAGLINIDGDIYYVRSSGKVATGEYYITNTNGMPGFQKGMKLTFGADGKLLTKTTDFGSVINGYYYVGGKIAYGAGVVKMEDENGVFYIYVKSNGQLATGRYWPTTLNGELAAGEYDWGTDGKYYPGN